MTDTELTLAGIDISELNGRVMNNAALIKLLVKKFTEDKNFEALVSSLGAGDMKAAESASHTLKGMCGNMSIKVLFLLFTRQVDLIREGKGAEAAAMMSEITEEYNKTIHHMTLWLNEQ